MKSKRQAAKILLAAGWSRTEIKFVLGDLSAEEDSREHFNQSPWWSWLDDASYSAGSPLVKEWEAWLASGK